PRHDLAAEELDSDLLRDPVWSAEVDASGTGREHLLGVLGNAARAPCKGEAVQDVVREQPPCSGVVTRGNKRSQAVDQLGLEGNRRVEVGDDRAIHRNL